MASVTNLMIGLYIATHARNKGSVSNIASEKPTIEWAVVNDTKEASRHLGLFAEYLQTMKILC